MNRTLEHILPKVQKPARYTGGEYNAIVKDRRTVDTRYALCFPDTYEIGMSNLGCRILYGLMNEVDGLWCERCYAPWGDMEDEMRREGLLLYGLESGDPISDFDIIGFSLGYEMAYSNVLNMLDLAGLPLRSADRPELTPLIVAGGTCAYNPEPLAPFVDLFVVGEGETKTVKLEKYHADLADMLDNFTLDEFKVSDENGNTVKGSELTKNPAVLMWLEQGKEPTEHILNEMLEQEADFQNLPADIIFMVKDKAALENAKLTKVLSTFPRIRVLYDTFVPNVETLARRMYVDPEKLPLIIVTTKELNAVYACSGYNVGSGDMLVKICRNFAGK
mgnify:CR=1 FL=1